MPSPLEKTLAEMANLPSETIVGPGLTRKRELEHHLLAAAILRAILDNPRHWRPLFPTEIFWLADDQKLRREE